MKIALIVIFAVIIFIAILLNVPVYLTIEGEKNREKAGFGLEIRCLFFRIKPKSSGKKKKKVKKKEPPKTPGEEDISFLKKLENGIKVFKEIEDDVVELLQYISRRAVSVKDINFFMDFGFSDPMYTGIATGLINATVYNFLALLTRIFPVNDFDIKINPDFQNPSFKVYSKCIFRLKNVHIIITVLRVLRLYLRIKKLWNNYNE